MKTADIGPRVRALRKSRNWTLEALSHNSGVSFSTISKLENNQVAATFDTMVKVAAALGLTFDELLKPPERPQVVGRRSITRAGCGLKFSTPNYDYDVHAPELKQKRIIPLVMEVKNRTVTPAEEWSSHEGEEFIYVLDGSIELHTEFYEPVLLDRGDSAYIDSAMAHAFVNVGEGKAEMLSICLSNHLAQVNGKGPFDGQPLIA